jgi:hypothetical protein
LILPAVLDQCCRKDKGIYVHYLHLDESGRRRVIGPRVFVPNWRISAIPNAVASGLELVIAPDTSFNSRYQLAMIE